jgi:hypothetical protein
LNFENRISQYRFLAASLNTPNSSLTSLDIRKVSLAAYN